ncbi:S49 family peptidase [Acidovorax sp. BLS4]|uniref:S49 family peptidase n=1 Tax=Acidovorax sp. BLS4 TaxID=3273430 RepID=UPI002943D349|nr:S49 family peptidase [Paracidovorax avenae]WOI43777.1 S49 family peptidase [Paracidovorax avenae]
MKSYLRTSGLLFNQPLMVTPDVLDLGVRWANQVMSLNIINLGPGAADRISRDDDEGSGRTAVDDQRQGGTPNTGVAVIPVHGVLVPRAANLEACETMTSYEGLRNFLRQAINDPMVERIVLDIDSPGGSVAGAFELAADIRSMAQSKPITGLVNFMGYSGGYLIASACSEVVVSRTSGVGSIGVIASHMDRSAMAEKMGVKITTVFAGAHKNDLTPHEPISDQSLRVLTDLVNEGYEMFVSAVADYRDMPAAKVRATEAGLYRGQAAITAGLADRLASPQDAVDDLSRAVAESRAQRQAGRVSVRAAALQIQSQI